MLSVIEREARLTAFLRSAFPERTVVASPAIGADARRRGAVRLPEIRVAAEGADADGILRWSVEFACDLLTGCHAAGDIDRMLTALATAPADRSWRMVPGSTPATGDGVFTWRCLIEEAWTPADASPQMMFAVMRSFAILPAQPVPKGTSLLPSYIQLGAPPAIGDHLALSDAEGMEYLGKVVETIGGLRTTRATRRAFGPSSSLIVPGDGIESSEAGIETATENSGESTLLTRTLGGIRQRVVLRGASFLLRLHFPIIPAQTANQWQSFLRLHRELPALALVRRDTAIVEAAPQEFISQMPGRGAAQLTLEFAVSDPPNFAPLAEESSP